MDIDANHSGDSRSGASVAALSIDALRAWLQRTTGDAVTLIETHVSWVLLGATHVWKLKKPVRTGFLDFTLPSTRLACCREEVRLNRRLAPELYLGVVAVVGSATRPRLADLSAKAPAGGPPTGACDAAPDALSGTAADLSPGTSSGTAVDLSRGTFPGAGAEVSPGASCGAGAGITAGGVRPPMTPVIDHAVVMRRFDDGALLSERVAAGTLDEATVGRFARRLAAFQRGAARVGESVSWGSAQRVRDDTAAALRGFAAAAPAQSAWAAAVGGRLAALEARLAPLFDERRRRGWVREGHGDLHLANVVVLPTQVTAFDCIEFDSGLRWIDVQNDAAFLAMDLLAHGRADLAWGFVDDWLAELGDYGGVPLLRYYLAYRALVRALVAALRHGPGAEAAAKAAGTREPAAPAETRDPAQRPETRGPVKRAGTREPDYARLVDALLAPARPRLLITHGVSGSGKSHVARALLAHAGAIRVRSDVERRRLYGLDARARSGSAPGAGIYDAVATARVYERLQALAGVALDAGWPTIVDATFLRRAGRERLRRLAHDRGVPFAILACEADEAVLRARVQARLARGVDPSEADVAVLARQLAQREALDADEQRHAIVIDTARGGTDLPAIDRRWRQAAIPPA